ncbi:MAG: preprotein translocase subunit SecE [Bacteroidales bacterium]|nr:preprotein translocase subunit SecE [Bacteroidales bacterium]
MGKLINNVKESFVELTKKTSWPSWDKLQSSAILVMVTTVLLAVVLWLIDLAFQSLMSLIYAL